MATLNVRGLRDPRPEPPELGRGLPEGSVTLKDAVLVQVARAGGPRLSLAGLQPDDIVEIELQDGLRLWSRVEDVSRDLLPRAQRGQLTGDIELPSELSIGPASRSLGGWAIKALKVLGLDLPGTITDVVADRVEGKLQPGSGLYRCAEDDAAGLRPLRSLEGRGPVLVFLHGTASSTSGSFSQLWQPGAGRLIGKLFEHYGGRVLAFQHRTLTESPAENALALANSLAELLAPDAEVHLVSHSRGGLVGELLARGMRSGAAPITADELKLFDNDHWGRSRQALEDLSKVLQEARPRVTRFVRVACPARGTTLADRRLDRYFTVLVNLVSLIPGLRENPIYEALTGLLAGVLKKRTDPRELPGLEAMMPTSPLMRMLNQPGVQTRADLHVLGGDLAGAGFFGRLKTLATDFYYRDDHDLVVNTPSMLGGVERTSPIRYWIDTGDKVTHFHYFSRPDTARKLVSALTGSSAEFHTLQARPSAVTSADYVKRAAVSRPVVFVLPGIMGSQLSAGDRPVWMKILELARGGLSLLAAGKPGIKATGLLADGYAELCAHLDQSHEVVPFPYDWRQPIDESARGLRVAIDRLLPVAEAANQPVRLLAHSMGGLVVRAMLADAQGRKTWERMCRHPGARFIMLGTPNGGSHAIPAMLMGRDALVKKLALVDFRNSHAGLLSTIAGFDGVLNLLPHGGPLDFFDAGVWSELLTLDAPETRGLFGSDVATSKSAGFRWALPSRAALQDARRLAELVQQSPLDPARMLYVAGVADETACAIEKHPQAPAGRRVRVLASNRGDGRVLWDDGIPRGIPCYYMQAIHGDLANTRRYFPAIVDLLDSGTTGRLDTDPPVRRAADELFEMREPMPSMVPDEAELVAAALGGQRFQAAQQDARRVSVRVVHDNLTNARHPVLVGHYRHDVIVGAEQYLDLRMNHRLSELLRMELYPGPSGTAVVVLNEPSPGDLSLQSGVIVAGLGRVGELTPGSLTATLAHALTMYGAEYVGLERRRLQREGVESQASGILFAPVTALLVGSGAGGLTLADSVHALLRAVQQANQRLMPVTADNESESVQTLAVQIDRLDILELYEDRAIEALRVLTTAGGSAEFESFLVDKLLVEGNEGLRRATFEPEPGWWQRLRVTSGRRGDMKFEAVTQAARAPSRLRKTQRKLVDGFVRDAIRNTVTDPSLGRTLFELLVPNDFKPYGHDRRKLALMLDPASAALPWELLQDVLDPLGEPLSVASGMIRQLLLRDERGHVLRAPANTALVIGNPRVSDPRFPSLPGAMAEASAVASVLRDRGQYEVDLVLGDAADPYAVLTALHERPLRILHLAAHGVFEFKCDGCDEPVSGLVLDDGLFFTAAEADQMRYVPELVFINCCHLGQTRGDASPGADYYKLAANLATQFIGMGARAVIAAGWEVDDAAAKTFATSFYEQMLQGSLYGDAVLRARKETYLAHGQTNTWGAYQCYGDPSFSLFTRRSVAADEVFVAARELQFALEKLAKQAREQQGRETSLLAALERHVAQTPASWWKSAPLCASAGQAFTALGQYERAIEYYQACAKAERALAPLEAFEQLANCQVRQAMALADADEQANAKRAADLLDQADKTLEHLLAIGETSERWSLLGGVRKRRSQLEQNAAKRRKAISGMREAYDRAYQLSKDSGFADAYPLANRIAAEVVAGWNAKTAKTAADAVAASLKELEEVASRLAGTQTDAFNLSAAADRLLLQALANRKLEEKTRAAIEAKYLKALSRGATARDRGSIRTQFKFFRRMIESEFPASGRKAMIQQLEQLEKKVLG